MPGVALTVTVGVIGVTTVIAIEALVVSGIAQVALLMSVAFITSLFVGVYVYRLLLAPEINELLTSH